MSCRSGWHSRALRAPLRVAPVAAPSRRAMASAAARVARHAHASTSRARGWDDRASPVARGRRPSPAGVFSRRWSSGDVSARAAGPRGGGAGSGDGDGARPRVSDEELRAAIRECRELLEEATRLAGEQARAELAASFLRGSSGTTGDLAVDMARVQLFFQGKGMRPWEAEATSRTLVELDSIYGDVELLAVKFDRLARTLPDVDVKAMVAADPSIMSTNLERNVEVMLQLFDLFPRRKVPRILAEAPRLLTCDDLEDRVRRTVECIRRVYPKETDESCLYALSEEPTLLFHLPDLKIFEERNRVDIAELPMTVQEQLVFATRNENE